MSIGSDGDGMTNEQVFPPHWGVEERERHRRHLEVLAGTSLAEREERIRLEAYQLGVEHGRLRQIDRAELGQTEPTTYRAAAEALNAAVRCVKPLPVLDIPMDARVSAADDQAHMVTMIADELLRWLSEHIEPRIDIDTCGSCSQPRERHDPECLYAPRGRGRPISGLFVDEVKSWPPVDPVATVAVRPCPHCRALVYGPGDCTDPWCPGPQPAAVSLPKSEAFARGECPRCKHVNGPHSCKHSACIDTACGQPEQQACPECRAGKHDNCGGRIPDEEGENLRWKPCPCAAESHPESLG